MVTSAYMYNLYAAVRAWGTKTLEIIYLLTHNPDLLIIIAVEF